MRTKEEWMGLALELAEATIGQTSPNPSVGAVVVKNGKLLGVGTHMKAGEPHAEVLALEQAGDDAKDADVYVTLEPCAHYGKTPPCAELLVKKQVRKVYISCQDPNPKVAGKGIEILKAAGIETEIGIEEERGKAINRFFFHFLKHNRPFVTLKAATTLDGKTATKIGDSKWITAEVAREDVHRERHRHDAILVGRNTVEKDNPSLTTRLENGGKNPIRVILDSQLSLDGNYHILDQSAPTYMICGKRADTAKFEKKYPHVNVIQLAADTIDIADALQALGEEKIQSVYVEGGGQIHASLLKAGMVDECHWYIAPKLLGGQDAISAIGGKSPELMKEAVEFNLVSVEQLGNDIKIIAKPKGAN
ncbi:diaminohydroxyphosphoribosylaminopyrimidine deaminase/5-amino-6-(5-phosphoribosylamino)uracil reductase [Gracilibacillus halotolerans]|uniref:Riboflavin biosynthesis protein RibD n=1 Tax=Gracilibacillus halotolerans TaxID=74386 RepID=A0A841RG82_9BACI|nr:bifunctional diaminohydroxyphosphoribosylaminopyrimidine deaminase/5-amino-6-(5-phosphoribosylamino)uracil reductase RibD [Gracilibacillus halotolerans]MBB6513130.1 diaminohydroxyphosphoribosylaminopyrimidine deaminase/5-amino-6-(5-phosphoribosylamino)uracil reductase [Gracilibacillus halotolerans]